MLLGSQLPLIFSLIASKLLWYWSLATLATGISKHTPTARAYTPAYPTNSTPEAVSAGLNMTDISSFLAKWSGDANGSYTQHIAYQFAAEDSTGLNEGVLLHMSEDLVNDDTPPSSTPWIALISCDTNSTSASPTKDIFTLAHEKGAVAAIVYSSFSEACVLAPLSLISNLSRKAVTIDIFASQTHTSSYLLSSYLFAAHIVSSKSDKELAFSSDGSLTSYCTATSSRLNSSERAIRHAIENEIYPPAGYLLARVRVWNATDTDGIVAAKAISWADIISNLFAGLTFEEGLLVAVLLCVLTIVFTRYSASRRL